MYVHDEYAQRSNGPLSSKMNLICRWNGAIVNLRQQSYEILFFEKIIDYPLFLCNTFLFFVWLINCDKNSWDFMVLHLLSVAMLRVKGVPGEMCE